MKCEKCEYSRKVNIEGKPNMLFCNAPGLKGGGFVKKNLEAPEWCPKKRGKENGRNDKSV